MSFRGDPVHQEGTPGRLLAVDANPTAESTPRGLPWGGAGVAALALGRMRRLWGFQLLFASLAAVCLGFCAWTAWFPVVTATVAALPDRIGLVDGRLEWPPETGRVLYQNSFLGVAVQTGETEVAGQTADVQLVLRPDSIRWTSLLGRFSASYPGGIAARSGRVVASAWWGAWSWVVLLGLMVGLAAGVIASWWFLATVYTLPTMLLMALFRRPLGGAVAWRLAAAAMFAGTLVVSASVVFYALQFIRVPGLLAGYALHFAVGWMWTFWGVLKLPRSRPSAIPSPFSEPPPARKSPTAGKSRKASNPFAD